MQSIGKLVKKRLQFLGISRIKKEKAGKIVCTILKPTQVRK